MWTIQSKKNYNRNWRGQRWIFKHPPPTFIRGLHSLKRVFVGLKIPSVVKNLIKLFFINKWRNYVSILEDLFRRSAIGNLQVIPPTMRERNGKDKGKA